LRTVNFQFFFFSFSFSTFSFCTGRFVHFKFTIDSFLRRNPSIITKVLSLLFTRFVFLCYFVVDKNKLPGIERILGTGQFLLFSIFSTLFFFYNFFFHNFFFYNFFFYNFSLQFFSFFFCFFLLKE
jgi:hypothetical protein